MEIIKLPEYFHHDKFDIILSRRDDLLKKAEENPIELNFDLSENKYISTLGLLLIAQLVDELTKMDSRCIAYYGKPIEESGIASFLKAMGLVKTKRSKEMDDYLKNFRVEIQRCLTGNQSLDAVNKLMHIVKSEFKPSTTALKALNWALWELVDNARVHGYKMYGSLQVNHTHPVYFCAFDYKNVIDVAILDTGVGVRESFISSGKEKYRNITNEQALQLAITDKESGNPDGSPGFGLFGCKEIARQSKGELVLISEEHKIVASGNTMNIISSCKWHGTMVSLSIPREAIVNLEQIFGESAILISEDINDLIGDYNEPN